MPAPFNNIILMFPSAIMPNDGFTQHAVTTTPPWLTSSAILWCSISSTGNVNVSSPSPLLATPFHSSAVGPLALPFTARLHSQVFPIISLMKLPMCTLMNYNVLGKQITIQAMHHGIFFFLKITGQSLHEILQPLHLVHVYQVTRPMNAYLDPLHLTQRTVPSPLDTEAYLDHAISAETTH
ncbi:hypothetical protein KP509_1Z099500 [Ceratopteris richardii]|nr:hypothetical protein KP509_1Z099400 [Ceratopteris richardii]KAH6557708.1 hypothetical protein KP509_1Z099500 [Ceratopteris richardii]